MFFHWRAVKKGKMNPKYLNGSDGVHLNGIASKLEKLFVLLKDIFRGNYYIC